MKLCYVALFNKITYSVYMLIKCHISPEQNMLNSDMILTFLLKILLYNVLYQIKLLNLLQ